MKTKTTLLAAAIFSLIAFAGYSQAQTLTVTAPPAAAPSATPYPRIGTFQDSKLPIPARLKLANDVIYSGTDSQTVYVAAVFMLTARPVLHLVNSYPEFADSVLADLTLGGKLTPETQSLLSSAIAFKTDIIPVLEDGIAYLGKQLDNAALTPAQVLTLKAKYAGLVTKKGQKQYDAQDYTGAIATATPVLGFGGANAEISLIFKSKLALRSPDVLSWAKLIYVMQGFAQTQAGIDAVSSAYRALDTNLVKANAFIQYQKDGVGANPLADVALPKVNFLALSAGNDAANKAIAGDNIGALKIAVNSFASAPSGPQLNSATAFVAAWLRNIDGNLVRANEFVSTQSEGKTFTISELSK